MAHRYEYDDGEGEGSSIFDEMMLRTEATGVTCTIFDGNTGKELAAGKGKNRNEARIAAEAKLQR